MSDTTTIDDVAKNVHDLKEAVDDMKQGLVDETKVKAIAEEMLENHKQALAAERERRGFRPDDETPDDMKRQAIGRFSTLEGAERLDAIQSCVVDGVRVPVERVAALTRVPKEELQAFHEASDNLQIIQALSGDRAGRNGWATDVRESRYYKQHYLPMLQAMDTATAAEGLEFVPRGLSGTLIERVNLELLVLAQFGVIDMPTNPFDVPGRAVSRTRMARGVENTADTGQTGVAKRTPGSRKITLTAGKFWGEALVSKEAEEDAIIAMLPFIQEELLDFLAGDLEDAAINGDTAATQDSDFAADDPRRNWVGLRKSALAAAKVDVANAAPTVANSIRPVRKKMGKYGVKPTDLFWLCSLSAYIQLLSDTNVLTIDKYGAAATLVTGELGRVDGAPILVSEYVRQDLNATGVFDNTTTNRTEILGVNRRGWLRGYRRQTEVQILRELYAEDDQDAVMVTQRQAFSARFPTATETIVGAAYNIAA